MNTVTPLIIALFSTSACRAAAAPDCTPSASPAQARARSSFTKETATIQEVLSTDQDGYRSRAYIVNWHGSRVLVSDPLAQSTKTTGDSINFIAARHELDGDRMLGFISTEHEPHRAADASGSSSLPSSSATATGIVEEVLSAQDDGFRFIAYIVEWHGSQVVIDDPIAGTNFQPGDGVSFWVSRYDLPPLGSHKHLQFSFDQPRQTTVVNQHSELQTSIAKDSAPVEAVPASDVDGYRSVAYLVHWQDTPIAVVDVFAMKDFAVGDRITFSVARTATQNAKKLNFVLMRFPTRQCLAVKSSSDKSVPKAAANAPATSCHG